MGWAEDQAARIKQTQDQRRKGHEWQTQRLAILSQDSDALVEDLFAYIRKELQKLKTLIPDAARLRIHEINPNNPNGLTVSIDENPQI